MRWLACWLALTIFAGAQDGEGGAPLRSHGRLAVTVLDETGQPLTDVRVMASSKGSAKRMKDWRPAELDAESRLFRFAHLPPGEITIAAARKASGSRVLRTSVHPSPDDTTEVVLGYAGLRVSVKDETGEAVESHELRLRYPTRQPPGGAYWIRKGSRARLTLRREGEAAPEDGVYRGITPGEVGLVVQAAGFPAQLIALDLNPGEIHDVDATLHLGRSLRGRIEHPDGRPAAGVRVQITRGTTPGKSHADAGFVRVRPFMAMDSSSASLKVGHRDAEVLTDGDGSFEFSGLVPGAHALRALLSPWARVDSVVQLSDADATEFVLTLPEMGEADVTLLLSEGVSAVGMELSLRAQLDAGESGQRLDESGTCRLSGIPAGEHGVWLEALPAIAAGGFYRSQQHVFVGSLRIEPEVPCAVTFDLRDRLPMEGKVRVLAAGRRLKRAHVKLRPVGELARPPASSEIRRGKGLFTPPKWRIARHSAPPGRYHVLVTIPRHGWRWASPDVFEVRPGGRFEFDASVPLAKRSVRIVDGRGRPLGDTVITWWGEGVNPGRAKKKTSADGSLATLALPPGNYGFSRLGKDRPSVHVQWEDGEGPLEIVIPSGG